MSRMSNIPVLKCKRCGRFYEVSIIATAFPDPDGKQLQEFMDGVAKEGLCADCKMAKNYFLTLNRPEDFHSG